jgi:DNA-binding Lrp family transcriptional regulator
VEQTNQPLHLASRRRHGQLRRAAAASQAGSVLPNTPLRLLDNLVTPMAARKGASPPRLAAQLAMRERFCWIAATGLRPWARGRPEARVVPFFVQIKCHLGRSYEVANKLADAEIASEVYSTAGDFDLLVKFYVEDGTDIGHFVNEKVQTIAGIQDTRTIITFKAFRG